MFFSGKVNTKAGKQFIQLEQPDTYRKMKEEKTKPDAWAVFIEVLAIIIMFGVAIFIWGITP